MTVVAATVTGQSFARTHAILVPTATMENGAGHLLVRRTAVCGVQGSEMRLFTVTPAKGGPVVQVDDNNAGRKFDADVRNPCPRCLSLVRKHHL